MVNQKQWKHQIVEILTIVLLICASLAFGNAQSFAADSQDISVYIDGAKVEFSEPPQNIQGKTMVPLRAIFEALGINVDWEASTQKIAASNSNVTINLQVGSTNASVGNKEAGFIETILDVAPQNINGSVLVPVRFIGEASGADVVWDSSSKTVNITSRPDRVFKGDKEFRCYDWGYQADPGYSQIGYCIDGVYNSYGQVIGDGFGKQIAWGTYVGMFKNDEPNGFGTYTKENGAKLVGDFVDGEIANGKFIFTNGDTYVGPISLNMVPHGIGTYTYTNGTTIKVKYINGEYSGIVDPTKPYDFYGNLISEGDSVEFMTLSFNSFIGIVTAIDGGKVKVEWYDIENSFGQSVLYSIPDDEFNVLQAMHGITFYTPQWLSADKLFMK